MNVKRTYVSTVPPVPWRPDADAAGVVGRAVAVGAWGRYLLQRGSFDEYTFFSPTTPSPDEWHSVDFARAAVRQAALLDGIKATINVLPTYAMSAVLSSVDGTIVFHNPGGPDVAEYAFARSRFSSTMYPITCVVHTISYPLLVPLQIYNAVAPLDVCDCLICPSPTIADAIRAGAARLSEFTGKVPQWQIRCFPHIGIDTSVMRPRNRRECRSDLGLPVDAKIILWLGRLSHFDKADLTTLIECFRRIRTLRPTEDIRLLLAGEDRYAYSTQLLAVAQAAGVADAVLVWPDVNTAARAPVYCAADVFISPIDSVQETYGITVLEAMACGIPVVASDWVGYRSHVEHGSTGFLVPTTWHSTGAWRKAMFTHAWMQDHLLAAQSVNVDINAMCHHILTLLDSPDVSRDMGAAARRRAATEYDWNVIMKHYESAWDDLQVIARNRKVPRCSPPYDIWSDFRGFAATATEGVVRLSAGTSEIPLQTLVDLYPEMAEWLDVERLQVLIERGRHCSFALSIDDPAEGPAVAWLLKHGYLEAVRA